MENLESRQLLAAAIGAGTFTAPRNIGTVQAFQYVEQETASQRGLNDSFQSAEVLPLGTAPGRQNTIDVRGFLPPASSTVFGGNQFADVDFYAVDLRAGDILDVAITGAAGRFDVLYGPGTRYSPGAQWFGTTTNMGALASYPPTSPLMTIGNAVAAQVVPDTGRYYIRVAGGGLGGTGIGGTNAYTMGLRVYRPVLESAPIGTQQTVFLDFDGELFPTSLFAGLGQVDQNGNPLPQTIRIPSLQESLNALGFVDLPIVATPQTNAVVNRLIDDILERVDFHFNNWVPLTGGNGNFNQTGIPGQFGIRILNSRDHADPGFNNPFVTRVFVGGTTDDVFQAPGLYGLAQNIDVGNFNPGSYVFTLLDAIGDDALNNIPISLTATRLEVAAQGIALTISHELAHSFGLWHTDRAGNIPSIIDANVDLVDDYELGFDGIFGTADDTQIPFPMADRFNPIEGLVGFQRVTSSLAWGLATGTAGTNLTGTVFNDLNRDGVRGSGESGQGGITVFVDANGNGVLDPGEISTVTAADGTYSLPVAAGNNLIAAVAPAGFVFTTPSSRQVSGGASGVNFGLFRPNAQFTGRKFADLNGNGFADPGEPGVEGAFIYIDLDMDGRIDVGEPRAVTDANGNYRLDFSGLPAGTYTIREVVSAGFEPISPPSGSYTVFYDGLNPPVGLDFGNRPSRDYGDAPDSYMTLRASGGPSHGIVPGLSLGQRVDRDLDGQPSPLADGDDRSGPLGPDGQVLDDEDGVRLLTPLAPGSTATFEVFITNTTGQPAFLQAWFDFDQNGRFTDPGNQVLRNVVLPAGANRVDIPIPQGVPLGNLFTRWRLSLTPDLGVGGPADSGEVEDHLFTVLAQPRVANDDVASVPRNSSANQINVLANDFETPENRLQITSIDRFSLNTRGQVTIAPNGRSVFYTPPIGFVGQDRFTYTVTPAVGPPATATVTVNVTFQSNVPIAIDDSFEVAQGSNNIALNVLDNDLPSTAGGITIISVTPGTQGGTTSLAGGNQSVRYTPRAGFAGTEQFTYTISDSAGNVSSATVTVNLIPGSRADDVVDFRIEFLDIVNQQPITNIQAGNDFLARVVVEDLRAAQNQTGVFSAFLDLLYTEELVAVVPNQLNPLGFEIQFGNLFHGGFSGLQSGDAMTPGLLNEVGSQRISLLPPTGPEGPLELFTVRFQAVSPGIAVFQADPADEPINETTVFDRMTALAINELRLGVSELVINPSGVAFTSAIDDAFPDGRDSFGNPIRGGLTNQLDVLRNDLLGPSGQISEFFLVTQPDFGVASINNGFIQYTADAGVVNRFDSFTYGIVDGDGVRSTAEVTLFVGDPIEAQNTAPPGAKPFDVDIRLQVVDGSGNPISRINPGSRFGVQVIVQDLRSFADQFGVFAAFTDLLYDANLATPSNIIQGDPFDFDVIFGPEFGVLGAFGTADRAGIIDEFGSFLTNTNPGNVPPNPALTQAPVLLATLFFDAIGTGDLRLVTSPADASPFRDTLLFQPPEPVPPSRIRYNVTTVTIGAGGSGEFVSRQNGLLPVDVNGDGIVSPVDALMVINQISRKQLVGEGESAANGSTPTIFSDVNGDGQVTPVDALMVINYLSRARLMGSPVDVNELWATTPSSGGIVPVDSYAALQELHSRRLASGSGSGEVEGEGEAPAKLSAGPTVSSSDEEADDEGWIGVLADDVAGLWK